MDYLTNFYKNQAEQLQEQLSFLQSKLKSLQEGAFTPSWGGPAIPDSEAGTIELENMARQKKRTSLFGPVKQSKEWEELNAEIQRRRGANNKPTDPKQMTADPDVQRGQFPVYPEVKPTEQLGPVGSPSAVPTKTEVEKTQKVADETGLPTALPTNVSMGGMHMTDMDGNPIYVTPTPKKPSAKEFNDASSASQEATEVDYDEGGDYRYSSGGYAQSPTSWSNRYPSKYQPKKQSAAEFNDEASAKQQAMEVDYDTEGDYKKLGGYAQSPTSWSNRYPGNYQPKQPKPVAPAAMRDMDDMPPPSDNEMPSDSKDDWVTRWANKLGDSRAKIEGMRQKAIKQIQSENT